MSTAFEPRIPPKGWQKGILRSAWELGGRNHTAWLAIRGVARLSLTSLSLDAAWQSGRKARKLLGVWFYLQILALLPAFPVGLEILQRLLGFEWIRYLVIAWYPFERCAAGPLTPALRV